MRRTLLFAATILLGGCMTQSGIIDTSAPPQADPVMSQIDIKCPDDTKDPSARCVLDWLARREVSRRERVQDTANPRRPSPPRIGRR